MRLWIVWVSDAPTDAPAPLPRLIHVSDSPPRSHHYFITLSSSLSHHSPTYYAWRHAVTKRTSEVGANPESRLKTLHSPTIVQLVSLCLTQIAGEGGIYCLLHTCWIRESFATFSARCILSSPACIYHQRNDPFLHSKGRSAGVDRWNIVYAFHMYSSTVIVQLATFFLILTLMFCFVFYGLFARQYIVLDVCIFKKKKDDYICVLLVPLSGSFGWTCLSATIF